VTQRAGERSAARKGGRKRPVRFTFEIDRPDEVFGEVSDHTRSAVKEALLAVRSALDVAIRIVDPDASAERPRASKIEIE